MKKVLLIIFAGMLSFSQANANILGDASLTVGMGYNEAVFAATGQERNHDESGTLRTTVEEYGAFNEEISDFHGKISSAMLLTMSPVKRIISGFCLLIKSMP